MTKADYAMRGVGLVLGLMPAGSSALKFGKEVISEPFLKGAGYTRNAGFGRDLGASVRSAPDVIPTIAKGVGELLSEANTVERANDIRSLIKQLRSVEEGGGAGHLRYFRRS